PGQKLSPSVAACRRWAPAPPAGRDGLLALRPQRAPDRCPRRGRRRLGGAGRRQVAAPARPGERAVRGAGARGPRLRLRVHARLAVGVRPAGNDPDGDFDGEGAGTEEEDLRRRAALRLGAVLAVPAVRRELQRGPRGRPGGGRARPAVVPARQRAHHHQPVVRQQGPHAWRAIACGAGSARGGAPPGEQEDQRFCRS
ncbi:unnamed protein product, partial [Prorocentrum cordatum]